MAPTKSRPDELRSEASSTKERVGGASSTLSNGKARRVTGNIASGSSLRDVVTPASSAAAAGTLNPAMGDTNPIQWSSFESSVLHAYRYDYRLNTPAAFDKPYNQIILSQSAVGRMSPTMASKKDQRRQSKDQLAATVRKHFKSMGIVENEVIVDFLYKVRHHNKNFRMRFAPQLSR